MSRNLRLSFVREDVFEPLKEHMMLGMVIGNCQLSKLYAYNGLTFSDGIRFEDMELSDKKIIVIDNPVSIVKDLDKSAVISKTFTASWKKKVRQLMVPIFAPNTRGSWLLRFDDVIVSALEEGPLSMEEWVLPEERKASIARMDLNGVPENVVEDVVAFCLANRQPDTEWVVLPVTSFNYYYGNAMFEKKWLNNIPKEIILRDRSKHGVSRVKLL